MDLLTNHFGKFICRNIEKKLGITTVEEAKGIDPKVLMSVHGVGKMFIHKLNNITMKPQPKESQPELEVPVQQLSDLPVPLKNRITQNLQIHIDRLTAIHERLVALNDSIFGIGETIKEGPYGKTEMSGFMDTVEQQYREIDRLTFLIEMSLKKMETF